MDLVNVALQVIAIIAIIAVGAFIIVFLSDLLISIIDDHKGIFFRRGKGREEDYHNTYSRQNAPTHAYDLEEELSLKEATKAYTARTGFVDMQAAELEQEELEKKSDKLFEDDFALESEEDKLSKERIALLEERNKQLEEQLKKKDKKPEEASTQRANAKFDDFFADLEDDLLETPIADEEEEEEDISEYEKIIKEINEQAAREFEKASPASKSKENSFKLSHVIEEEEEEEEEIFEEEKSDILTEEIEKLKAQLEKERQDREIYMQEVLENQKKLEEERRQLEEALKAKQQEELAKADTVVLMGSEEEYLSTLAILQERLKDAKKQLRINKRDFVPLNKIKRTLERDQQRLRRKEAQVAKQKVVLFGVNNNDIDPQKQAELEQEMDMLEGLKLSVQHCEDVMRENADRFPVLEQTNKILTENVKNLTDDVERVEKRLKELRKKTNK